MPLSTSLHALLSTALLALLSTALLALALLIVKQIINTSINKALLSTCDAVEHVFLQLRVLAFTRLYLVPLLSTCFT